MILEAFPAFGDRGWRSPYRYFLRLTRQETAVRSFHLLRAPAEVGIGQPALALAANGSRPMTS